MSLGSCLKGLLLMGASVCVSFPVWAECEPREAQGAMNEPFYRALEQATELINKQQYNEAIGRLQKMVQGNVTDYERAIGYYNLGYAYNLKDDLPNAVKAFQVAIDENALPQAQHEQLLYNTGQLYILTDQFDRGIKTLEQYFADACSKISPEAYIFLASAYTEKKRYREAIAQVDRAIVANGGKAKETWLQLKVAGYFDLKDYNACAEALVDLIATVPAKPDYWKQLYGVFFELKKDEQALATLVLAHRQGFVQKPNEIKNLYSVYMLVDLPFKAGLLYEEALAKKQIPTDETNLDALANAWINARELPRAEKVLTQLAENTGKGDYYYKLGAMYGDDERWEDSIKLLQQALNRGGLKRPGEAHMRIAVAHYNLQQLGPARDALQKAAAYDETRRQASEWLTHLRQQAG